MKQPRPESSQPRPESSSHFEGNMDYAVKILTNAWKRIEDENNWCQGDEEAAYYGNVRRCSIGAIRGQTVVCMAHIGRSLQRIGIASESYKLHLGLHPIAHYNDDQKHFQVRRLR